MGTGKRSWNVEGLESAIQENVGGITFCGERARG